MLFHVAASDGLKVLSMYVESFVYGTSTVVETKGATDTFRSHMWSENVELSWTLRHNFAMRSRTITDQVGRKCEQSSEALPDDHIRATEQCKHYQKQ